MISKVSGILTRKQVQCTHSSLNQRKNLRLKRLNQLKLPKKMPKRLRNLKNWAKINKAQKKTMLKNLKVRRNLNLLLLKDTNQISHMSLHL